MVQDEPFDLLVWGYSPRQQAITTTLIISPIPNPINTDELHWFWIAGGVRRHAASNPDGPWKNKSTFGEIGF